MACLMVERGGDGDAKAANRAAGFEMDGSKDPDVDGLTKGGGPLLEAERDEERASARWRRP